MKLSVLFVNSIGKSKWGGGEKWMLNTAKGFLDRGHNVTVAVKKRSILYHKAKELGLKTIVISYTTDFSLISVMKLHHYFRKHKTDIAVCCLNRDVRIIGAASKLLPNRPKVIGRQGVQLIRNSWKYKITFSHLADGILTNSQSLKKIYDSYGWWQDDYVKVIYNGITESEVKHHFDFGALTDIRPGTKVVISAGRLNKQKGFQYLIETAKIAKEEGRDWKFFIAGSGKLYKKLSRLIQVNGLEEYVFLIGFQENIISLFYRADVFVLPSLYEGMPNVLLEAMLAGLPVLTTPVNGAFELINDGVTGLFIDTKNAESIYKKLDLLFSDDKVANQIALAGQHFVKENFDLDKSINQIVDYFKDVIYKDRNHMPYTFVNKTRKCWAKIVSVRHKNVKAWYYLKNFMKLKLSKPFSKKGLQKQLRKLDKYNKAYVFKRVNYYNKLSKPVKLSVDCNKLKDFKYTKDMQTYFFDAWKYKRMFSPEFRYKNEFGDVTHVPNQPAIVKSRPIEGENENSVLLNLNKVRHFAFVKDNRCLQDKMNKCVWRGNIWKHQPQRILLLERHFDNPICDIGHTNIADIETTWKVEKLTIHEQLKFKFILSIEGNDVATNLKWIMSSNSLAVMPTPKFETWFMEGSLKPDYHYIHIKDDYSDLDEKLKYYITHPEKAEEIRKNANRYVDQFKVKKRENLISTLVLKKYFEMTN